MDDRTTGGEDAREGDDPQSRCLQETLAEAQLVFTELSRLFEQVTGAKRSAALRALDDEQDAVLLEIHPDLLESYKALAKEDSAKRARLGARLDVEIQLRERQHAAILHQISCEERSHRKRVSDCLYSALYKQILFLSGGAATPEAMDITFKSPNSALGPSRSLLTLTNWKARKRRIADRKEELVQGLLPEEIAADCLAIKRVSTQSLDPEHRIVLPPIRALTVGAQQDKITLPSLSLGLHLESRNAENNKENASLGALPSLSKTQDSRTVSLAVLEKTKTLFTHPLPTGPFLP